MAELETIEIDTIRWTPGKAARIWFFHPRLDLPAAPPFISRPIAGEPAPLQLLEVAARMDAGYPRPEGAPVLFLLPEFSLRPSEVEKFAEIVEKSAENTVFVSGVGHLTRGEALSIESGAGEVWEPGSEHLSTNCALIGFGGSKALRLQPKIVPSWEERDRQASGRVVRYFVGHQFQFIVVICSELLNRPQERTTIESVIAQLDDKGKRLNLVVWIQHNPDPRSDAFGQSILRLERPPYCPTVLVVSTRNTRSSRLTNFAVSGAIVPRSALATNFKVLDGRFQ